MCTLGQKPPQHPQHSPTVVSQGRNLQQMAPEPKSKPAECKGLHPLEPPPSAARSSSQAQGAASVSLEVKPKLTSPNCILHSSLL